MSNTITCDFELSRVCKEYAQMVWDELVQEYGTNDPDELEEHFSDTAHEYADQSEHVIYTNKAMAICGNCNTDEGEVWLEEIYEQPFNGCGTFDEVCSRLAFAEMYCRIMRFLQDIAAGCGRLEEGEE